MCYANTSQVFSLLIFDIIHGKRYATDMFIKKAVISTSKLFPHYSSVISEIGELSVFHFTRIPLSIS